MFDFIKNLFNSRALSKEADEPDNVATIDLQPEEDPVDLTEQRKELQAFVWLVTKHLHAEESSRLCKLVDDQLMECEDSSLALSEATLGDDGQKEGQWFCIQVDWKAREEISWQVNVILENFSPSDKWTIDCEEKFKSVPESFHAISDWLESKGLSLIHWDEGSDSYFSFIVETKSLKATLAHAKSANLLVQDNAEFLIRNEE